MTIQQEAYQLIDNMPDESVKFLVQLINNMSLSFRFKVKTNELRVNLEYNIAKLKEIESLENGWNGNEAPSVPKEIISTVGVLLNSLDYQPEIFPTGYGTVQMEYERKDGAHMEIDVLNGHEAELYVLYPNGKERTDRVEAISTAVNNEVKEFYGKFV